MVVNKRELPILDYAAELCQFNLHDTAVIARQHLLSTTYDLFERLFAKNLKPKNTFLLGKCYSTNKETFDNFTSKGVYVSPYSTAFDSYRSFDEQSREVIEELLDSAAHLSGLERVVILDDGGDLILAANKIFKNACGVEQTSSGFRKISQAPLEYPVVNVARSEAKLKLESPMIAEAIAVKLQPYLKNDSKVLVVGNGPIGNSIYEKLSKRYFVTSKQELFSDSKLKLDIYDIIIGCTGDTIIQPDQLKQCKKGAILASASSSDTEFPAVNLRKKTIRTYDCHQTISVDDIILLNSGFPINFDGSKDSVPPEKIQLTRSLLLVGIYQALESKNKGLIELNREMQGKIVQRYEEIYVISSN